MLASDVVVQDADAGARSHGLRLPCRARNLEACIPVAHDFPGEIERGGPQKILDIADPPMPFQRLDAAGCAVLAQIDVRRIDAERVVREFGRDEPTLFRSFKGDGNVCFPL